LLNKILNLLSLLLGVGHIELEEDNVGIVDHILLTLLSIETGGLHIGLTAVIFNQIIKLHGLGADEPSLKISVDNTGGLWGLGSLSEGPALDLVSSSRKKVDELQVFVARLDDPVDH
jgi:hypothetical protein